MSFETKRGSISSETKFGYERSVFLFQKVSFFTKERFFRECLRMNENNLEPTTIHKVTFVFCGESLSNHNILDELAERSLSEKLSTKNRLYGRAEKEIVLFFNSKSNRLSNERCFPAASMARSTLKIHEIYPNLSNFFH